MILNFLILVSFLSISDIENLDIAATFNIESVNFKDL